MRLDLSGGSSVQRELGEVFEIRLNGDYCFYIRSIVQKGERSVPDIGAEIDRDTVILRVKQCSHDGVGIAQMFGKIINFSTQAVIDHRVEHALGFLVGKKLTNGGKLLLMLFIKGTVENRPAGDRYIGRIQLMPGGEREKALHDIGQRGTEGKENNEVFSVLFQYIAIGYHVFAVEFAVANEAVAGKDSGNLDPETVKLGKNFVTAVSGSVHDNRTVCFLQRMPKISHERHQTRHSVLCFRTEWHF